jgi:uncharacterized protein (TIGR01777 family)
VTTHLLALQLMALQGCLGAFDTLYHHELTEALPQHAGARTELRIHAVRALIYSGLFIGLSAWAWHGAWAWFLIFLFAVEIALTLWDFVVEDQTRLLPATERILHTVLAINGAAFITLLALDLPGWMSRPTAFASLPHGLLSGFLAMCGVGVGLSGMRDAIAAYQLKRQQEREKTMDSIHFCDTPKNVLVTGGTGFIGQMLVKALLADGQIVTVLTRNPKHAAWLFNGRVRCIGSMDELPATQAMHVIVNLAGARILGWRWTAKRRRLLLASRIGITQRVVDWIARAQHKPQLLLSASAIGYYGIQQRGDRRLLTEESNPQPIFMSQLCQEWEHAAQAAARHGVKTVCMRFGLVLGRQGALPMMLLPIKLGLGGRLGDGRQWLSWIHVEDLLRAIAHVWRTHLDVPEQRPISGAASTQVYNFTAPEVVTQHQFSKTAARLLHRPCLMPTPALPVRLMLGEQADLLLEGQCVTPTRLQKENFRFDYPTMEQALRSLS